MLRSPCLRPENPGGWRDPPAAHGGAIGIGERNRFSWQAIRKT